MEFYLPNIAFYLMALLMSSLLLYVIGRTIACLFPEWRDEKNAYQTVFNSFLIGYTTVLPIFAIIWSGGNSLFWLLIILWLLYLLWWRKPRKAEWVIDWRAEMKALAVAVAILTGCFAMLYYFCFLRSEGQIFSDQIFSSNVTQSILTYHNEAYFRTDMTLAQPYHWGDSWTTALWAFVFGAQPIYILFGITYPFLLAMCIFGVAAIAKGRPNNLPLILCVLLGILYFFYWNISSLLTPWHGGGSSISGLKNYLMVVFAVWGASYVLKSRYEQAFMVMLMLVVFYSPLAAGFLTLVCLLSFFIEETPKSFIRTIFNPYVIGAVIIALYYGLFYMLQPEVYLGLEGSVIESFSFEKWAGFVVKRVCRPIAGITPTAILLGLYLFKTDKQRLRKYTIMYACVIASCLVACMVGGVAKIYSVDGWQVTSNYNGTISQLFVNISWIYLIAELAQNYRKVFIGLVVVAGIVYPTQFFCTGAQSAMFPIAPMRDGEKAAYEDLKTIFDTSGVIEMGYFRNYTLPDNYNTAKTRYDLYFPMDRMVHILPNGYHPYCLSAYDLPEGIEKVRNDMDRCELWQYGVRMRQQQGICTEEQIISAFVEEKNINYIITESGALLPDYLNERFRQVYEWDGNVMYYKE